METSDVLVVVLFFGALPHSSTSCQLPIGRGQASTPHPSTAPMDCQMFAIVVLDMASLIAMRLRTWAWEQRAKLDVPVVAFTSEIISTMTQMAMTTTASTVFAWT